MEWIEAERNIKFLSWGKLGKDQTEDDAVVVKVGESIEGIIIRIEEVKRDDGTNDYKYRIKPKGEDKEVLIWSNAAIRRQQESLELKEGELVRFTYLKDYKTQFGATGRDIKVAVQR